MKRDSAPCVDRPPTIVFDSDDIVWLRNGSFHAGRSQRHAGNGKPRDVIELLTQESPDYVGRHVPLDGIATHPGGMASGEVWADSVTSPDHRQLGDVDGLYFESVISQVTHPLGAAASSRALVHGDDWRTSLRQAGGRCLVTGRGKAQSERGGENYGADSGCQYHIPAQGHQTSACSGLLRVTNGL